MGGANTPLNLITPHSSCHSESEGIIPSLVTPHPSSSHPSSFPPHPSPLTPHPSPLIPSPLILHPSLLIPHPSSLPPHPLTPLFLIPPSSSPHPTLPHPSPHTPSPHTPALHPGRLVIKNKALGGGRATTRLRFKTVHKSTSRGRADEQRILEEQVRPRL